MEGDFRIGDRTVVPTLNQILRGGTAVHVEPKVMRASLLARVARPRRPPLVFRVRRRAAYQRSLTPICICLASRVAEACPKLPGKVAFTIVVAESGGASKVTEKGDSVVFTLPNRKFVLLNRLKILPPEL
jgi:hypothetical protein